MFYSLELVPLVHHLGVGFSLLIPCALRMPRQSAYSLQFSKTFGEYDSSPTVVLAIKT